jgi:hypothetical protein
MNETFQIDKLTHSNVLLVKHSLDGMPHRVSFVNSASGREIVRNSPLSEAINAEIFAAWGEKPTVKEQTEDEVKE